METSEIAEFLLYQCDLIRRTKTSKNEYGESVYTEETFVEDCYLDYPKNWLKDMSESEIKSDGLLFLKPCSSIQVNDKVTNVKNAKSIIDDRMYKVKGITRIADDEWIHHLEVNLTLYDNG